MGGPIVKSAICRAVAMLSLACAAALPGASQAAKPDEVIVTNAVTLNPSAQNPVTLTNPADIAKAAVAHPFHFIVFCTEFFGANGCRHQDGAVPNQPTAGTLVIEFVSGVCDLAPGVAVSKVQVFTEVRGLIEPHFFALTDHTGGGSGSVSFAQSVRLYHDSPDRPVGLTVLSVPLDATATAAQPVNCFVTLSGQVVN